MKYEVVVSENAERDLREIYEYIASELQSPENAAGQLDRLEKAILSLDHMPHRCREYQTDRWESRHLRILPVDNYCIFYVSDDEHCIVSVIRVLYGARDLTTILDET